jgi:hypothetical protein
MQLIHIKFGGIFLTRFIYDSGIDLVTESLSAALGDIERGGASLGPLTPARAARRP